MGRDHAFQTPAWIPITIVIDSRSRLKLGKYTSYFYPSLLHVYFPLPDVSLISVHRHIEISRRPKIPKTWVQYPNAVFPFYGVLIIRAIKINLCMKHYSFDKQEQCSEVPKHIMPCQNTHFKTKLPRVKSKSDTSKWP